MHPPAIVAAFLAFGLGYACAARPVAPYCANTADPWACDATEQPLAPDSPWGAGGGAVCDTDANCATLDAWMDAQEARGVVL